MFFLITLCLFLSFSLQDIPLRLFLGSPIGILRRVTPPGLAGVLGGPKAWQNSVCQVLSSVCRLHWTPRCTLAPTVFLPSSCLVLVHMVQLVSKPPDFLGYICFLLPGSDFDLPSFVVSLLTPGYPVSSVPTGFSPEGTGLNIWETPVGG